MDNADLTTQNKSLCDLSREALWFSFHTLVAVCVLAFVVSGAALLHPNPDSLGPKLIGTLMAVAVPLAAGYLIARSLRNSVGRHIWVSGLLVFCVVCVFVLDLPTGNGLCEGCLALDKLWRTFFDIAHGSGLMGGDGLLAGTWTPLAMIGYSIGTRYGLKQLID